MSRPNYRCLEGNWLINSIYPHKQHTDSATKIQQMSCNSTNMCTYVQICSNMYELNRYNMASSYIIYICQQKTHCHNFSDIQNSKVTSLPSISTKPNLFFCIQWQPGSPPPIVKKQAIHLLEQCYWHSSTASTFQWLGPEGSNFHPC